MLDKISVLFGLMMKINTSSLFNKEMWIHKKQTCLNKYSTMIHNAALWIFWGKFLNRDFSKNFTSFTQINRYQ